MDKKEQAIERTRQALKKIHEDIIEAVRHVKLLQTREYEWYLDF